MADKAGLFKSVTYTDVDRFQEYIANYDLDT